MSNGEEDFEITLTVQNDGKTVGARSSSSTGEREATGELHLDPLRKQTVRIFQNWLNKGKIDKREELEVLGTHLYRALFDDKIAAFFASFFADLKKKRSKHLRVQLSFQDDVAELAGLPWEFLYCPEIKDFLATHVDLVLSRFMPLDEERETLSPDKGPLKVLIATSQPEGLNPVAAEEVLKDINSLAEKFPEKYQIEKLDKPTIARFKEALTQVEPHVLHFIGHGRFNIAEKFGEIALLKPDEKTVEWCSDKYFAQQIKNTKVKLRFVFLHLCHGATADENLFYSSFSGLAPQLISANIPAVVAMQYPIANWAAIAFSKAFYKELAKGSPVDQAVQMGRIAITEYNPQAFENRVFGTPVLYMHSKDGIIAPETSGGPLSRTVGAPGAVTGVAASSDKVISGSKPEGPPITPSVSPLLPDRAKEFLEIEKALNERVKLEARQYGLTSKAIELLREIKDLKWGNDRMAIIDAMETKIEENLTDPMVPLYNEIVYILNKMEL